MSVNSTIFEPVTENVQFMDIHGGGSISKSNPHHVVLYIASALYRTTWWGFDFEIEPPPRSPIYSPCILSYWNDHLISYRTHAFFPIGMTT